MALAAMAATVRLLSSRVVDCHLCLFTPPAPRSLILRKSNPRLRNGTPCWVRSATVSSSDRDNRRPRPFIPSGKPLFLSISCSDLSKDHTDRSLPDLGDGFHLCDSVGELTARDGSSGGKGAIWTVVLLGWLGAEEKHLKRYADIYHARGFQSIRFVVPLWELVGLDLGRNMEEKVARLAAELTKLCSENERDGRKRYFLFHTFSNTGWLVYGSILKNLQSRSDVIDRIKGCVIDSGPSFEISPKVWAAGFCAAMIKKRSLAVSALHGTINGDNPHGFSDNSNKKDAKPHLLEIIAMFILEKFFSIILTLPDVNQRLATVISILSKHQPPCPQLYLYSSADMVIPASSIESFLQQQKSIGRNVHFYNFVTSPHVDHFRSFPHIYSAKINEFVKECRSEIVCRT